MLHIQISENLTDPDFVILGNLAVRVMNRNEETNEITMVLGRKKPRRKPNTFVLTEELSEQILVKLGDVDWRYKAQSVEWVGIPIASVCGFDLSVKKDMKLTNEVLTKLVTSGKLRVHEKRDSARRIRVYVCVTPPLFD